MTSETKQSRPFSVVVGLDFTDAGGFAFQQAARIAKRIPHAAIHLVHVFEDEPTNGKSRDLVQRLRLYANEQAAAVGGLSGNAIGIHLRTGNPVREIVQLASELGADLIVLGAHKHPHMKSWVVGSTAEHLLAMAPCPVMVAGPKPAPAHFVPSIEPPCPDCETTRKASGGTQWWCERHAHHAKKAHSFSYQRELPYGMPDYEVIPTGLDLSTGLDR